MNQLVSRMKMSSSDGGTLDWNPCAFGMVAVRCWRKLPTGKAMRLSLYACDRVILYRSEYFPKSIFHALLLAIISASTMPGISWCGASMVGGQPSSLIVLDVTGPMERRLHFFTASRKDSGSIA